MKNTNTHTYLWKQNDWYRSSASLAWLILQCRSSRVKVHGHHQPAAHDLVFSAFFVVWKHRKHSSHHKEEEEEEEEQNQSFFLFMKLWAAAAAAGGTHWCRENQTKQKCKPLKWQFKVQFLVQAFFFFFFFLFPGLMNVCVPPACSTKSFYQM